MTLARQEGHAVDADHGCARDLLLATGDGGFLRGNPSMPACPVTATYATDRPFPVQPTIVLAAPYSRSSGWAATARACFQSSGIGVSGVFMRAPSTRWCPVGRSTGARTPCLA
jgi:hypothetical protein